MSEGREEGGRGRESGRRERERKGKGGERSCWNFNRPREKKEKTWRERMSDGRGEKRGGQQNGDEDTSLFIGGVPK